MLYVLSLFAVLLVGAGYLLGSRRGWSREEALRTSLDERDHQLTLLEHELLRHAAVDPATGLHTPEHFQEFLEREWRRASRERKPVTVLMVELDHFRALNERQTQPETDRALKAVGTALKPLLHRPGDVLARYGATGTLAVVLGGTDVKGALVLAERLRATVERLEMPNPAAPAGMMTATIGVAAATPARDGTWQDIELIAAAERALTRAREAGRNTIVVDTPASPLSR